MMRYKHQTSLFFKINMRVFERLPLDAPKFAVYDNDTRLARTTSRTTTRSIVLIASAIQDFGHHKIFDRCQFQSVYQQEKTDSSSILLATLCYYTIVE
jgi:hypothetical protein